MDLSTRNAYPADEEFLYSLHKATMQTHVVAAWGEWDEDWQRNRFRANFHPGTLRIVQLNGRDIGVFHLQTRAEELFLVRIEILPSFQNQGIGTRLMTQIIEDAHQQGKPVALQVLKANIAARAFYQRLGFGITGENDTHYIMAYEMH